MLGDLVEFATKLFEVIDRLKQSQDEDRQRIANYFHKVGDCLQGIAEELRNGNSHHGKWGELQEYAQKFPTSISEAIGHERETELSLLLERIVHNTPDNISDIQEIEATGGKFKALAVNISIEEKTVSSSIKEGSISSTPSISRNTFLYGVLGTATAILAGTTGRFISQSKRPIKWRMVSFLGESAKDKILLYQIPYMIRDRLKNITGDKFILEIDTKGHISTEEILGKVSEGQDIQCGFSGIYYETAEYRPLYFGCAIPFGLSPQEQTAWLSYKKNSNDDLTYIQNLYREIGLKVIPFPAGATGGQMGGWFKEEVNSIEDFNERAMRILGLGADVLTDYFGIKTDKKIFGKSLSLEKIYDELYKGTIEAAEWIGPHDDLQLNLHEAGAKHYYYPGWWEPSTTFDVQVNAEAWAKLPLEYKRIFEAVCYETYTKILSEYDRKNAQALVKIRSLEKSGSITIRRFPDEVLRVAQDKTETLLQLYDTNPEFEKVHVEWKGFKKKIRDYSDLAELTKIMFQLNNSTKR